VFARAVVVDTPRFIAGTDERVGRLHRVGAVCPASEKAFVGASLGKDRAGAPNVFRLALVGSATQRQFRRVEPEPPCDVLLDQGQCLKRLRRRSIKCQSSRVAQSEDRPTATVSDNEGDGMPRLHDPAADDLDAAHGRSSPT
jgi:hypothetical protein